MNLSSLIGIFILLVGVFLVGIGIGSNLSITEKVVEGVSGRSIDQTSILLLGGLALIVSGGIISLLAARTK